MTRLCKAGVCVIFSGLFLTVIENLIYWITEGVMLAQFRNANLLDWSNNSVADANVVLIVLLTGCLVGGILLIVGLLRKRGTMQ